MRNYTQQIEFFNKLIDKYLAKSAEDVNGSVCTQHYSPDHGSGCHNPQLKKMPQNVFKPGKRVGAEVYKKVL